jgi:aromatic ring-opening dioxygenase catalytic subunit (LigB family)
MSKTLFIPHGGGPLPLINESQNKDLNDFLRSYNQLTPKAIVIFSAHYETNEIDVIYDNVDELTFDYYGFPKETYDYKYNPPKDIVLGTEIVTELKKKGYKVTSTKRGFDHGVFVPLMLMFEEANIPVVQISINKNLDANYHIELGKALQFLRSKDILIIGSGYSFHNLREFFSNSNGDEKNDIFHNQLIDLLTSDISEEDRTNRLQQWEQIPHAKYVHPRSEHFIPLLITYGINQDKGNIVLDKEIFNKRTIAVEWNK